MNNEETFDHFEDCVYPAEHCKCIAIKREYAAKASDRAVDEALEAHREERAS